MIFKIQPLKVFVKFQQYDLCTNFKSTLQGHVESPKLVPQFRQFLNVWHIQNLEQPLLIWAGNCGVKGCSKFWIFYTFKNCLNCDTNSFFKKQRADKVLIFFFLFHTWPIFDVKILEFWKKNVVKMVILNLFIQIYSSLTVNSIS